MTKYLHSLSNVGIALDEQDWYTLGNDEKSIYAQSPLQCGVRLVNVTPFKSISFVVYL